MLWGNMGLGKNLKGAKNSLSAFVNENILICKLTYMWVAVYPDSRLGCNLSKDRTPWIILKAWLMVYTLIVLCCLHHQACICQPKQCFQSEHGELVYDAANPKWQPQARAAWPCAGLQYRSARRCHHFRSTNGFVVCWDQKRTRESCNTAYCKTQAVVLEHKFLYIHYAGLNNF